MPIFMRQKKSIYYINKRKKCANICRSPISSYYNGDLFPPNALAFPSREEVVLKRFKKKI